MALNLLDSAVERVHTALDTVGALDNTLIIFASDNGGCSTGGARNYPLRGQKGSLFEGGTRVESFLSGGLIPPKLQGTSYNGLFHVSDWFPTILDIADIAYTPDKVQCHAIYIQQIVSY
jgi:arylsulfatase A-like enzyme